MKHLGDITKIDWSKVEPVDVVTGGSPCQDLSVAGKRAGLAGKRSGLYMEQIRCVKELREADVRRGRTGQFIRPRYMVWENVAGAFSSGNPKGSDFAAVIEEIIKIAEQDAVVCVMPPSGGWAKSGCYYDSNGRWSIAWRVHDAQFWGVPQRRKRIALVADFGGLSAPEILFEREGLRGYFAESRTPWQSTPCDAERGSGANDRAGKGARVNVLNSWDSQGNQVHDSTGNNIYPCLRGCGGAGYQAGYVLAAEKYPAYSMKSIARNGVALTEQANHICASDYKDPDIVAQPIVIDRAFFNQGQNALYDPQYYTDGTAPTLVCSTVRCVVEPTYVTSSDGNIAGTLDASYYKGTGVRMGRERTYLAYCIGNGQVNDAVQMEGEVCKTLNCMVDPMKVLTTAPKYIARRLTPLECERLQGYPDGWTDIGEWVDSKGKKHKDADSPRYKALGNSIALPFWCWLAKRISAQYERDITIGSLFDGIGGFPYAFEKCGGKALWASEIEEFPMAVTKLRFKEE